MKVRVEKINEPPSGQEGLVTKPDVIVRTFNSESTIASCLTSVTNLLPVNRLIVVDHHSTDGTLDTVKRFGCQVYLEDEGLGKATTLGIARSSTDLILFIDSDITVKRKDFVILAQEHLKNQKVGCVVGTSIGNNFSYGLPLGMAMFRRSDISKVKIPGNVMSRETYFIQKHFRENGLKVKYIPDSNVHNALSRKYRNWPEWQGSWVRLTSGLNPREVVYSLIVSFLLLSNSRNIKNFFYIPIFQLKLLRGFLQPERWSRSFRASNQPSTPGRGAVL